MGPEHQLTGVLDGISDGFLVLDRGWHFVYLNRAADSGLRLQGRSREKLLGTNIWAEFPELRGSTFDLDCRRALTDGATVTFQVFYPPLGVWLEARAYPVSEGLAVSFRDVTESKRREAQRAEALAREQAGRVEAEAAERRASFLADTGALLSSSLDAATALQRLARLIVPALADCCIADLLDDDGLVTRTACASGHESHLVLGDVLQRLPTGPSAINPLARALATGQPRAVPHVDDAALAEIAPDAEGLELLHGLGVTSYMMLPLVARGRTLGVLTFLSASPARRYTASDLALAQDVATRAAMAVDNARLFGDSDRRRREAEALTELSRLISETLEPEAVSQRVVETVQQLAGARLAALYRLDRSGDLHLVAGVGPVVEWNPVLVRGTGAAGRAIHERAPIASNDVLADPRITFADEVRARIEASGYRSVLAVPLLIRGRVTGALTLGGVVGRLFKAEEVRLLERFAAQAAVTLENASLYTEERAARSEAEEANRAKDDFLAMLSHELRTPLQAMLGWARMLAGGKLDEVATRRAAETIERNTRLQTQLIEDLLDVSRIVAGKLQLDRRPVHLVPVIEAAVEAVRPAAVAKGLAVETELDPSASPVWGDPARLQQVVWNLLSNAVKFTPPAGRVEIRLELDRARVRLVVTDSGQGIPRELLPHIFERFRQADSSSARRYGGLGLGLAIAQQLVAMHDGEITAASDGVGLGATFTVTLPVMPMPAPATGRRSTRPGRRRRTPELTGLHGLRVLAVDDEGDTRELLAAVLAQAGAQVRTAASVAEALGVFDTWLPDLLVADLAMPEEDGLVLIARVRARPPERGGGVPAVALTAFARGEDQERALTAGFQIHLAKPADPARLVALLAGLAQRPAA